MLSVVTKHFARTPRILKSLSLGDMPKCNYCNYSRNPASSVIARRFLLLRCLRSGRKFGRVLNPLRDWRVDNNHFRFHRKHIYRTKMRSQDLAPSERGRCRLSSTNPISRIFRILHVAQKVTPTICISRILRPTVARQQFATEKNRYTRFVQNV